MSTRLRPIFNAAPSPSVQRPPRVRRVSSRARMPFIINSPGTRTAASFRLRRLLPQAEPFLSVRCPAFHKSFIKNK